MNNKGMEGETENKNIYLDKEQEEISTSSSPLNSHCLSRPRPPISIQLGKELYQEIGVYGTIHALECLDRQIVTLTGAYARDRCIIMFVEDTRYEPPALAVLAQELMNQLHSKQF